MSKPRENTIPVANIGRCPVGVCEKVHKMDKAIIRLETKVIVLMLGVGAVVGELAFLILRGAGIQ